MDKPPPQQPRPVLAYRTPGPEPEPKRPTLQTIELFILGLIGGFAASGAAVFVLLHAPDPWRLRMCGAYVLLIIATALILANIPRTRPIGLGLLMSFTLIVLIPLGICGVALLSH